MNLFLKFYFFVIYLLFASVNTEQIARNVPTNGLGSKIAISIIDEPFFTLRPNESDKKLTGNDRYMGYCVDLIEKLAHMVNITFELRLVNDDKFGSKDENGTWNGIIGELVRNEADLAIAPLVISTKRETDIDFSTPFMSIGISIMMKKQREYRFLKCISPYDPIWLCIIIGYTSIAIGLYLMKSISEYDFKKSFAWWVFSLIIFASYVLNMAIFLNLDAQQTIKSAEDLTKQADIQYGTVNSSSTSQFFKNTDHPVYSRMWNFMNSWGPNVFVKNNLEGFNRVKNSNGKYAFLLESTMNEYYNQQFDCSTVKVGEIFGLKDFGIAFPKGSSLKDSIDVALLKLKEDGYLEYLKYKWWNERSKCSNEIENTITDVSILFYILILGAMISVLVGIFESFY